MPFLDDLSRRLTNLMPSWLNRGPAADPTAYTRVGRNPVYQMSPEDYAAASSRANVPGAEGFMVDRGNTSGGLLDYFRSPAVRGMLQSVSQGHPTVVMPHDNPNPDALRHEAVHALLAGHEPDPAAVEGLIPRQGAQNLWSLGYKFRGERASEVPARLMSDPGVMGMAMRPEEGQEALQKYLKLLPPEHAARLARVAGIPWGNAAKSGDQVTSFQKPNDVF